MSNSFLFAWDGVTGNRKPDSEEENRVTNQEISVDSPENSSWIPAIPSLLPLLQPLMSDILQPIWCTSFPSKANYCFTHQLLIVMAWIHIFFSGTWLLSSATHLYMKYLGTPCSASAAMSICLWLEPHRVLKATTNGRVIRTANTVFFEFARVAGSIYDNKAFLPQLVNMVWVFKPRILSLPWMFDWLLCQHWSGYYMDSLQKISSKICWASISCHPCRCE